MPLQGPISSRSSRSVPLRVEGHFLSLLHLFSPLSHPAMARHPIWVESHILSRAQRGMGLGRAPNPSPPKAKFLGISFLS